MYLIEILSIMYLNAGLSIMYLVERVCPYCNEGVSIYLIERVCL